MNEVEVKILEVNREKLEKILDSFHARKIFEGILRTQLYVMPRGQSLRVRDEGGSVILTHKVSNKTTRTKQAYETELNVEDFEAAKAFLHSLGYQQGRYTEKKRVSWKLHNTKYDFDSYINPKLPELLEIESSSEERVLSGARKLGFKYEHCLPWNTDQLFKHYKV